MLFVVVVADARRGWNRGPSSCYVTRVLAGSRMGGSNQNVNYYIRVGYTGVIMGGPRSLANIPLARPRLVRLSADSVRSSPNCKALFPPFA